MKKLLIIIFFSFYSYAFSIDPNLMYGLGSVKNVPAEYNPVIGLSFLKFGIIKSWLESSAQNSVIALTRLLFRSEGQSLDALPISYLTPETIGHIVKIIDDHKNNLDQLQQAIIEYLKTLPEFKNVSDLPEGVTALLDLMVDGLRYVNATTVYPKGAVQSLLLAYLCAISESRDDIQEYFQGFLDDSNFVLPLTQGARKITKKSETEEKTVYKNYFCSMQKSQNLDSFISSFANTSTPYDALQNLVLLFFNFKDGSLIPNNNPSSLINYIDAANLGTIMRIFEQYSSSQELVKELQNYLVGLNIKNRVTGEFLNEESFRPLLIDLSESLNLTKGKNAKYSYTFFEDILHGCVCSRLNSVKDIENYCKGFFVHVTDNLIDAKKKEFACCLSKYPSEGNDDKHEKEEPWELEFEHGHGHKEGHDKDNFEEVADEIVERSVLFDLQNEQVENSVEAIITELVKMRNWQEKIKDDSTDSSNQTTPVLPFSVGGFYTMKKRAARQKALQQETELFAKTCRELKNLDGVVYQRIETKQSSNLKSQTLAFAAGFKPDVDVSREKKKKKSTESSADNQTERSQSGKGDASNKPATSSPKSKSVPSRLVSVIADPENPAIIPVVGFTAQADLKLVENEPYNKIIFDIQDSTKIVARQLDLNVVDQKIIIPPSANLDCTGMQPTVANLALGLQKVFGLTIIPRQKIHVLVEPEVAAQYFDAICKKMNWDFDVSEFDVSRPFELKIGTTKIVIDLNMQRKKTVPRVKKQENELIETQLLLPASEMKYEGALIIPPPQPKLPVVNFNSSTVQNVPESLVATILLTGLAQAQEIEKYQKFAESLQWIKNIQILLQAHRALFEFVSLIAPKPYERVMSKLNDIMSSKNQYLVGYELQNFFEDSESTYRQGITQADINQYFEYAPIESIQSLLSEFNKFPSSTQKYDLLMSNDFSAESVGSLFERIPTEDLLELFDDMSSQQRLDILKKIPQASFKSFVDDLSMQDFDTLSKGMNKKDLEQLQNIKVSETQNLYDVYFKEFISSYQHQQLGKSAKYITIDELQHMNMKELEELASQRQKAYDQWRTGTLEHHQLRPNPIDTPVQRNVLPIRVPMIPPVVGYRRYLQAGSLRHYLAEHGGDVARRVARDVVRSGMHGLK